MRLLVLSNLFPPHVLGGYELGALANARAAQRAGHAVRVLTSAAFGVLEKVRSDHELDVRRVFEPVHDFQWGCFEYQKPGHREFLGGVRPANQLALSEAIANWRPDAIWIYNPIGLGPVGILESAAASGVPTVLHLMDHVDDVVAGCQREFNVIGRWRAAKRRVHAIACSAHTLERNLHLGPFRSACVVPSGVEVGRGPVSRPGLKPSEARPVRLVHFGQLHEGKATLAVLEAFRLLREQDAQAPESQDLELHLIGTGPEAFVARVREYIAVHGLSGQIRLHGMQNRQALDALLSGMDLAVLPLNEHEPFGYVAVEAALHGLCVAVGATAGAAELFPSDYPYFISRRDDPACIAEVLRRMLGQPAERRRWESRLPEHMRAHADLDAVHLPRCLAFIQKAIAQHDPAMQVPDALTRSLAAWQTGCNLRRLCDDASETRASRPTSRAAASRPGHRERLRHLRQAYWSLRRAFALHPRG